MELEFDKEMDAILRKARGGTALAAAGTHLDADVIAAFAENALPQASKLLYVEHLADCDRCRSQLAHTISMNAGADATAASSVSEPLIEVHVPWYQRFFNAQGLALAMGGLVLVFSGVLGYIVLENRGDGGNATVSQVTEQERAPGGPFVGDESAGMTANTNTNANAAVLQSAAVTDPTAAANAPARTPATGPGSVSNTMMGSTGRELGEAKPVVSEDKSGVRPEDEASSKAVTTGAPPPPAPMSMDGMVGVDNKKDADAEKEEGRDRALAKRKQADDLSGYRRDLPPAAAKTGPSRSGPLQTQNQSNRNIYDMTVSRVVGGKTFNNRNGAWYDSGYGGQATLNVRRGSEEYKKLDRGLRNIANELGGTVVVVWKGKAYRVD